MLTRFHKKKIIGGNLLKNVFDKVKGLLSSTSKLPTIKDAATTLVRNAAKKAIASIDKAITDKAMPKAIASIDKAITDKAIAGLNDRSRAILSNLIAGSGFRNYLA